MDANFWKGGRIINITFQPLNLEMGKLVTFPVPLNMFYVDNNSGVFPDGGMMVRLSIKVKLLTTQAREDKEKTPKCLDDSLEQLDCSKNEKGTSPR